MSALPALLRGFFNTLLLGLLGIGIGVPAGLLISLVRLYAPKPFRWLAIGYIDIFRAMPVLVVLILIYYALPFVGIRLSSWASATHGLRLRHVGLFGGGVPLRHREHPQGPVRGRAGARPAVPADAAQGHPAAGGAPRHSADHQQLRVDVQGHVAGLDRRLPELLKEANDAQALYANPSPLIGAALVYLVFLWPMVRLVGLLERRVRTPRRAESAAASLPSTLRIQRTFT